MYRIFNEIHVKYLMEFIEKYVNSIRIPTVPLEKHATKLLILMDLENLKLLELHFTFGMLAENEIDELLRNYGFMSKINLFERKAILADLIKRRLIKIIESNHKLIVSTVENKEYDIRDFKQVYTIGGYHYAKEFSDDSLDNFDEYDDSEFNDSNRYDGNDSEFNNDNIKGDITDINDDILDSIADDIVKTDGYSSNKNNNKIIKTIEDAFEPNLVYSILKHYFKYENSFISSSKAIESQPANEFARKFNTFKPKLLKFYNKTMFLKHFSEEMLPLTPAEPNPANMVRKKLLLRHYKSFYDCEKKVNDKAQNETQIDIFNDPNIIIRKKKALYYEPSGPIDYRTNTNLNLNSLPKEEKYKVDPELYNKFNLRKFVDEILFTNNGIPVPKKSKYSSFAEFRRNIKGALLFTKKFLKKCLGELVIKQDEDISITDAYFIANELRPYLTLAELEYFYKIYLNSKDFRPTAYVGKREWVEE